MLDFRHSHFITRMRAHILNGIARVSDPQACTFYRNLLYGGYEPNLLIDALPEHKLIYINVPKSGSTTVKAILSRLVGRSPTTIDDHHGRKFSGLKAPKHVGISKLYRLATDPETLRFSFVRNPYDRLVSAWTDKFRGRPLVPGEPQIDQYLEHRPEIDTRLPHGLDKVLNFADFVTYASATADRRVNVHWQTQDDILSMPGISLDFIGQVESFATDIAHVLDHVNAPEMVRNLSFTRLNSSRRVRSCDYFTPELADRTYRAYERDFDRFGYPRALPNSA